jgi:hypothetical protein
MAEEEGFDSAQYEGGSCWHNPHHSRFLGECLLQRRVPRGYPSADHVCYVAQISLGLATYWNTLCHFGRKLLDCRRNLSVRTPIISNPTFKHTSSETCSPGLPTINHQKARTWLWHIPKRIAGYPDIARSIRGTIVALGHFAFHGVRRGQG